MKEEIWKDIKGQVSGRYKLMFPIKYISVLLLLFICISSNSQTRITAPIITNSLTDTTYSVTTDSLVRGGYRVLITTGQRDSIPQAERKYGMLVYVKNTDSCYQLKSASLNNSNWYAFSLNSGSIDTSNIAYLPKNQTFTGNNNFTGTIGNPTYWGWNANGSSGHFGLGNEIQWDNLYKTTINYMWGQKGVYFPFDTIQPQWFITSRYGNGIAFHADTPYYSKGNGHFYPFAIGNGSQNLQQVTTIGNSTNKGIRITNGTDTTISLNSDGSATFQGIITGNKGKLDSTATDGVVTPTMLNLRVPYTGATATLDMGANDVNARGFKVNGTGGNGHIDYKWQSADPTGTGTTSTMYADANGDFKWLNDHNYTSIFKTSLNNVNRTYTFPNRDAKIDSITTSTTTAISGLLKGGSGTISAASAGTDYQSPLTANSPISIIGNVIKADTGTRFTGLATLGKTYNDSLTLAAVSNAKLNISDTLSMLNGRINSITLNSSGVIHNSPINFVRSGGSWTGTMSLASQSAYQLFGTGNATATPSFRYIDSNYFNGLFAPQVRNNFSATRTVSTGSVFTYNSVTGAYNFDTTKIVLSTGNNTLSSTQTVNSSNFLSPMLTVNANYVLAGGMASGTTTTTTGLTAGVYTGISPTGGTGSGAVVTITVTGTTTTATAAITSVTTAGSGYLAGDVITVNKTSLGGSSGTVNFFVASVTSSNSNSVNNSPIQVNNYPIDYNGTSTPFLTFGLKRRSDNSYIDPAGLFTMSQRYIAGNGTTVTDFSNGSGTKLIGFQHNGNQVLLPVGISVGAASTFGSNTVTMGALTATTIASTATPLNLTPGANTITAGNITASMPFVGSVTNGGYKKVMVYLNGLTNTTTTINYTSISGGISFTNTPYIYGTTGAVALATATSSSITIAAATTATGYIFLEGY